MVVQTFPFLRFSFFLSNFECEVNANGNPLQSIYLFAAFLQDILYWQLTSLAAHPALTLSFSIRIVSFTSSHFNINFSILVNMNAFIFSQQDRQEEV